MLSQIRTFDLDYISLTEVGALLRDKPVVLVGSAISVFEPTNLPSGSAVTELLYSSIFSEYTHPRYQWLKNEYNRLPFEGLMECFPSYKDLIPKIKAEYSTTKYNLLHAAIADYLISGQISSIITTNYDLAFDTYLTEKGFSQIVKTEDDASKIIDGAYFKIHGCSISDVAPPICTLTQEEYLPNWKQEMLKKLLKDKTIIVLGYSGRDFDICPVIKNLKVFKYKGIGWLSYRNRASGEVERLSAYAEDLLVTSSLLGADNCIIKGDIVQFVRIFFLGPDKLKYSYSEFRFYVTDDQRRLWQLSVLNRLCCTSLGFEKLSALEGKINRSYYDEMLWNAYRNRGEYMQAFKVAAKSGRNLNRINDPKSYLKCLYTQSGCLLTYGCFISGLLFFNKAKYFQRRHLPSNGKIEFKLLTHEVTNMLYLSKSHLFRPLKWYLTKRARALIPKLYRLNQNGFGTLKDRQRLKLTIEGFLRIEQKKANPNDTFVNDLEMLADNIYTPIESLIGFRNMGLPNHELIAFRSHLKAETVGRKLTEIQTKELQQYIEKSKKLGLDVELLKLCRTIVKKGVLASHERFEYWEAWTTSLRTVEYHPLRKLCLYIELYYYWLQILL